MVEKTVSLSKAPLGQKLLVKSLGHSDPHIRLVLIQMGLGEGEILEKVHVAPLHDPFSIRIGSQMFTLRNEIGNEVIVEVLT